MEERGVGGRLEWRRRSLLSRACSGASPGDCGPVRAAGRQTRFDSRSLAAAVDLAIPVVSLRACLAKSICSRMAADSCSSRATSTC